MSEKNVNKQYEELLKAADSIANDSDKLTDEQTEDLFDVMENATDPAQSFPSNNGKIYNENTDPSQNEEKKVLVSANPITGLLNTIPYESKEITESNIDELINMEDEDFKKIEIGWDAFVESVKNMYPNADEEGLKILLNAVNRYRNGEKFPYFNALPEFIKNDINKYANMGLAEHQASNNTGKQLKNMLAKELFDTIITNNYSSKTFTDISKFTTNEINKEKDKLAEDVISYNAKLRKEYEEGFIKKAEEYEASGNEEAITKAASLRKVSRMFIQSYTYEDMYNAFKNRKIKVKPIQVEKFNRTCQEFNRKYYNNTFQIKDVGMTVPTLDRCLDKKYNINTIKKFIIIFINYTRNFVPSNIDEHVFMFYFIQHILALDIKIPGKDYENFNEIVKQNIYKFLDLVIERDNKKQELKKGDKNNEL